MTLSDSYARFQGQGVTRDALGILCTQLTCDLFAIPVAKFLLNVYAMFCNWLPHHRDGR